MTNEQAVRVYLDAVTTGGDDASAALADEVADAVEVRGPLGSGSGRAALLDGVRVVQPLFAAGTWSEPVADGDGLRVSATFRPGAVLGAATLTFRFDGDGRIVELAQELTPGAPPPPVPVALDEVISAAINGALDNGTPIVAAYVDRAGQPQLSLRGTTQVFAPDQLAVWIRDRNGGLLRALPDNPRLTFFYRDPATRANYQIQGRGRVDDDPAVRDAVFDNSPEREQALDPERRGVAVVVDIDRVTGRGPAGAVNMERGAGAA